MTWGKATKDSPNVRAPTLIFSWLLSVDWPSPGLDSRLEDEAVDRSLFLSHYIYIRDMWIYPYNSFEIWKVQVSNPSRTLASSLVKHRRAHLNTEWLVKRVAQLTSSLRAALKGREEEDSLGCRNWMKKMPDWVKWRGSLFQTIPLQSPGLRIVTGFWLDKHFIIYKLGPFPSSLLHKMQGTWTAV